MPTPRMAMSEVDRAAMAVAGREREAAVGEEGAVGGRDERDFGRRELYTYTLALISATIDA